MSAIPAFAQGNPDRELTINAAFRVVIRDHIYAPKPKLDAPFCRRWLSTYLAKLDPAKMYFLEADILEFETHLNKLPGYASTGARDLQRLVTSRYQECVESALGNLDAVLNDDIDFSVDEEISLNHAAWAKTEARRAERWRLQIKYDLLVEISAGASMNQAKTFVGGVYESIYKQAKSLTTDRAVGIYIDSFCQTIGPHSWFITEEEMSGFRGGMIKRGSVGLRLRVVNGRSVIRSINTDFRDLHSAASLEGCELLAIRERSGKLLFCREIYLHDISSHIEYDLPRERITLELYDHASLKRFSVDWVCRSLD